MPVLTYTFAGKLWLYGGPSSWFFVSLPKGMAKEIRMVLGGATGRGWGSVRVTATVAGTTWKTSVFPDKKAGTFLLPVKAQVRKATGWEEGGTKDVTLAIDA